jgi:hypothetical protein
MDSIRLDDLDPISINISDDFSMPASSSLSSSYGPGIELLMNDRVKSGSGSKYSNKPASMGDLDRMEEEFSRNEAESSSSESKPLSGFGEGFFGWSNTNTGETGDMNKTSSVQFDTDSNLGEATSHTSGGTSRTYDGFAKINEVPLESAAMSSSAGAKMNERERRRCKRMMLKKLEEWYEKGIIKDMHHFSLDSPFDEIEDEYESAMEDKRKKDSVKLQGWWFMTFVNSVEYANASFNPFDINLDGWGEQVSEDLNSYDEIFGELYHKYKGAKMSPELSMLLRLGFSAAMVNFTNKALSSATPGFNDVIKQSPELMKMFTNATVQSMSQNSPGFAFANNLANGQDPKPNTSFGPPPAPVQTKPQTPMRPSMQFTQNGPMQSQSQQQQQQSDRPMFREQGVDMRQTQDFNQVQQQSQSSVSMRPEMRGPQNPQIHHLLSGLKTTVAPMNHVMPQQVQQQQPVESMNDTMLPPMPQNVQQHVQSNMSLPPPRTFDENDSMISVTSLQDLQNTNMPKRTRRKKTSERNTISLDI